MKRKLLLLLAPILLLVACEKTPDNVKEKADILDGKTSKSDSSNSDITYTGEVKERGTLEEIRNQLEYDLESNSTRINVDSTRIGTGTIMPTYNVKIAGNDLKTETQDAFKNLVKLLFDDRYDINDEKLYEFFDRNDIYRPDDPNNIPHSEFWLNDNGELMRSNVFNMDIKTYCGAKETNPYDSLVAHSTGCVYGSPEGLERNLSAEPSYVLQVGVDDLNVAYPMEDGTMWKVSDAVKFAEEFYNNEDLMAFEPVKGTYEVQYILIIPTGKETYGYFFELNRKDHNGNYLDTYDYFEESIHSIDLIANNEPFFMGTMANLWCIEVDKVYNFSKGYSFEYLDITNSGDELLTLNGALSVLDNKLAKEKALSIRCAELSYGLKCKGYPYHNNEHIDKSIDGWEKIYYDNQLCRATCDFELRPIWVFKTKDYFSINPSSGEVYYVDAITEEVSKLR